MRTHRSKQRSGSPSPSAGDVAAVQEFATSRELQVVTIASYDNHWYYWIRGKLWLSNLASIYLVTVKDALGKQSEMHLAVTPNIFKRTKETRVLLEKGLV